MIACGGVPMGFYSVRVFLRDEVKHERSLARIRLGTGLLRDELKHELREQDEQ